MVELDNHGGSWMNMGEQNYTRPRLLGGRDGTTFTRKSRVRVCET